MDNLETELARIIREEVRRQLAENGGSGAREPAPRINNPGRLLGAPETKAFLLGATVALAAAALWPSVKPALKPVMASTVQSLSELGEKVKSYFAVAQESLADLVAEARSDRVAAARVRRRRVSLRRDVPDIFNNLARMPLFFHEGMNGRVFVFITGVPRCMLK